MRADVLISWVHPEIVGPFYILLLGQRRVAALRFTLHGFASHCSPLVILN